MMAKICLNFHSGVSDVQEVVGRVRGQSLALLIINKVEQKWRAHLECQCGSAELCDPGVAPRGAQCWAALWQRGEQNSLHSRAFLE